MAAKATTRGGANGYAALVKQRTEGKTKRRKLDDYETPEDKTAYLVRCIKFRGPILEPAAGSGRMAHALSKFGGFKRIKCVDIKHGPQHNFLKRTQIWPGDIITNPPYRDGLADAFVRHALKLADGRVAMLMETKYLHGDKRAATLFLETPPEAVIVIPERVYFFEGSGKQIKSQFFNHLWIIWPPRKVRNARTRAPTKLIWASDFG